MSGSRFSTFLETFDPDAHRRGEQWEEVCQWFLRTDHLYRAQLTKAWLWNEWPGRWGPDAGIDLVGKAKDGKLWAIQAKAYAPSTSVTKHDVDTFLSESARSVFSHRLLIATTSRIARAARQAMTGQEKPVIMLLRHDLERRDGLTWPPSFAAWRRGQFPRPRRKRPRRHQERALRAATTQLTRRDRGQLVLACGTGKTLVALWLHERLEARRTLVLVPSLSLLKQILLEWVANWSQPFEVLPVCSDDTVRPGERDAVVSSVIELGFPATTVADTVKEFLRRRVRRVVFSTYQSSPVIADALQGSRLRFDLVAISEFPKGRKYLTSLSFRGKASVRPAQVGGFDVNIVIHGSTAVRGRGDLVAYRWALWKLTAPWTHRTRPPHLGKRCAFSTSSTGPFPSNHSRKTPKGPKIALGNPDRPDLVIADEAHHCAGLTSSAFATVLDQSRIPARKRVFMTATPRYFTGRVVRAAREDDLEVASMDDETIFGPVLHRLRFAQAIDEDLLSDYRVLVVGIDDARYRRYAERGRLVALDKGTRTTDARSLASHIGVAKAMRRYDMRRVITFHGRVTSAQWFARTLPAVFQWMPPAERPSGPVWAEPVSGAMSSGDRAVRLDRLRQVEDRERGILSNARCLGEGVDIPTLDGIAFIDPKHSQIEIVQAVGRAIRKGQDGGVATIVIPVFVDPTADAEHALDASAFRPIAAVLRALRDHDEALAEEMDSLRRELGGPSRRRLRLPTKIVLDLPSQLSSDFSTAIATRVIRLTTSSWEERFAALQVFVAREGHARPRVRGRTASPEETSLGFWVGNQRSNKRLTRERRNRLEALDGWAWDEHDARWEDSFAQLRQFVAKKSHARVRQTYKTPDGDPLGSWVQVQRSKRSHLSLERRQRLESLDGWAWDALEAHWEERFEHLQQFVTTEGHARVPALYKTRDGIGLGMLVANQRVTKQKQDPQRRARLESLAGWLWNIRDARWEECFEQLEAFVARQGHAQVPSGHTIPEGHKLGRWVVKQRARKEQLSSERRKRLGALDGWVWDVGSDRWEKCFAHLQEFVAREGHAKVPQNYATPSGIRLGTWVRQQRGSKERLAPAARSRIEALKGWVWDAVEARREEGFERLQQFIADAGHAQVPSGWVTSDGYKLGQWVVVQRRRKARLQPKQRARFESLAGWRWHTGEERWEASFANLERFVMTHGNALVPRSYRTPNDEPLGRWVVHQRERKAQLEPNQRGRLEALGGWVWDAREAVWERSFTDLEVFVATRGHARVPATHMTPDGRKLGRWVINCRRRRNTLSHERRAQLEALEGWVWKTRTSPGRKG